MEKPEGDVDLVIYFRSEQVSRCEDRSAGASSSRYGWTDDGEDLFRVEQDLYSTGKQEIRSAASRNRI